MTGWEKRGQKEKNSSQLQFQPSQWEKGQTPEPAWDAARPSQHISVPSGNKPQGFQDKWNYPGLEQREGQTQQPQVPKGTNPGALGAQIPPIPILHPWISFPSHTSVPSPPLQEFPFFVHSWEVVPGRSWSNLQTLIKPWQHPGMGGDYNYVFNYINSAQGGH